MAACVSRWPAPAGWQSSRTSAGPVSALVSSRVPEALGMAHPCRRDALTHRAGWFALALGRELVVVEARHFDKVRAHQP